jgi:hypothetical protein
MGDKRLNILGASALRDIYSDEQLQGLNVLEKVKREEARLEYNFLRMIDSYEGASSWLHGLKEEGVNLDYPGFVPMLPNGMRLNDWFFTQLISHPKGKSRRDFRSVLLEVYTEMGVMLKPSQVAKLRELPVEEQDAFDYAMRRNQDYDLWKRETEASIEEGDAWSAFYRIRKLPAFEMYKNKIIELCLKNKDMLLLAIIAFPNYDLPRRSDLIETKLAKELFDADHLNHALAVYRCIKTGGLGSDPGLAEAMIKEIIQKLA